MRIEYIKQTYLEDAACNMALSDSEIEYLIHRGLGDDDIWRIGGEKIGKTGSMFGTIEEAACWTLGFNFGRDKRCL
tara:strand:+ start:194 stop:421 length:228 start_codon:yes stop_codon:yes gene_type:complete